MRGNKNILKGIIAVFALTLTLVACGPLANLTTPKHQRIVQALQEEMPLLGTIDITESTYVEPHARYSDLQRVFGTIIEAEEHKTLMLENQESLLAWQKIINFLADNVPTSAEENPNNVSNEALLVPIPKTEKVYGVVVYEFPQGVPITPKETETAYSFSLTLKELYIVKDNCILAVNADFLNDHKLSLEQFKAAVEKI